VSVVEQTSLSPCSETCVGATQSGWMGVDSANERGGSYHGSLTLFGHGDDWLQECWEKIFGAPTMGDVGPGQYRCFFSHSFDCGPGPSRAYYFDSWPLGAAEPIVVLLHVHYWVMPAPDDGGLPKSINVRRGWRVDPDELWLRANGDRHDAVPPPPDMIADVPMWTNAMKQFLHVPYQDPVAEKVRACAALGAFEHTYFCPRHALWVEKSGACVNGGPTAKSVTNKRSVEEPGWNFTARDPYPLKAPREYPGGFEHPRMPADLVAAVLDHAELVRRAHPHEPPIVGGVYDKTAAWRGSDELSAVDRACCEQARRLAESSGDFDDEEATAAAVLALAH
jgi:hypothetical protein